MNIVLLSGGAGKRLWPLSNDIRSKQFVKVLKKEDGSYESMVQRVYRQIREVDKEATVTVATSETQIPILKNQLGQKLGISIEPAQRDTFPAIALATLYLRDVLDIDENEVIVVCPVDPYVDNDYFEALNELCKLAQKGDENLYLMGIEPTYPSEKYGYIIPESTDSVSKVLHFKEKPDEETAKKYIEQGALWNGGVFAFKIKYLIDKAHEFIDFTDYYDLFEKYNTLNKISFDYAVVEQETDIAVYRFWGSWDDLGTWNSLVDIIDDNIIGKGLASESCNNVHIINELNLPILCMGQKNVIVSASSEGILVSDIEESSDIKRYVDKLDSTFKNTEKNWGDIKVIDVSENSMSLKLSIKAGHHMNYHSHNLRDEIWNIISGNGQVVVDGMKQSVCSGDVITIQAGCKHTIIAESELHIIEVQIGREIDVNDKRKYEYSFD